MNDITDQSKEKMQLKQELEEYKNMLATPADMNDMVLFELCVMYCHMYETSDAEGKDVSAKRIDQYIMQLRGFEV